jgi:hypothetical protein
MTVSGVIFDEEKLREFSRRHRIRRLSLFGSILRPDFGPDSDVDLLVEFLPGTRISLMGIGSIEAELEQILQRRIDMRTPEDLSQYFRQDVVASARPLVDQLEELLAQNP